jgi:hypothetical protein
MMGDGETIYEQKFQDKAGLKPFIAADKTS